MVDDLLAVGVMTDQARIVAAVIIAGAVCGLAAILFAAWRGFDRRRNSGQPMTRKRRRR